MLPLIGSVTGLSVVPVIPGDTVVPREATEPFVGAWESHRIEWDGGRVIEVGPKTAMTGRVEIRGREFEYRFRSLVADREEHGTFTVVGIGDEHIRVRLVVDVSTRDNFGIDRASGVVSKELWRMTSDDTFQRCFWDGVPSERGRDYPVGFSTEKGNQFMIVTFQRAMP